MSSRRQKISLFIKHLRTLFAVHAEDQRPYWKRDSVCQDDNLHTFNCTWSADLVPPGGPAQKVTVLFTVEVDENTLRGSVKAEVLWKTKENDEAQVLPTLEILQGWEAQSRVVQTMIEDARCTAAFVAETDFRQWGFD